MRFRPLQTHEIAALSDDGVVAYASACGANGYAAQRTEAIQMLIFRHDRRVRWRVSLKVPEHLVEEVAGDALVEAIGSRFGGGTPGEFFSWLDTIVSRKIADHHRSPHTKVRKEQTRLPSEHRDDPDADEEGVDFPHERVESHHAFGRARDMLDNPMHREVIDLYVIEDRPAREVAERVGTSENNVHQIAKRFRELLRGLLSEEDLP